MMWTGIFSQEFWDTNIPDKQKQSDGYLVCRPLGYPEEGKYHIWKKTGKAVVWNAGEEFITNTGRDYYFDGTVMYHVPEPWKISRIDRDGSVSALSSDGHGACNAILVSQEYLFVDNDASYKLFKYPKYFSAFSGRGKDNLEAEVFI